MGTSAAYSTPKWPGVNVAVGDAASGHSDNQKAIGIFTRAYKGYLGSGRTGGGGSHRGVGNTTRTRSASSGAGLGHFIGTVRREGLDSALKEFNLSELRDKPLSEILDSVTDKLTDGDGLIDDNAIYRAMSETLNEIAEQIDSPNEFEALLQSDEINLEETLQIYYANMLAANFEQKEYSHVSTKLSGTNTDKFFQDSRDIIRAIVRDELSTERDLSTIDWNSAEGTRIADEINQEVLDILIP